MIGEAQIKRVKTAVGIETANCQSCNSLSSDSDGGEPEYSVSWPVCNKVRRYENLTSFPFKKEMSCWGPNFWCSKFADEMDLDEYATDAAAAKFWATVRLAMEGKNE